MAFLSKERAKFDSSPTRTEWTIDETMSQARLLAERAFPYFIPSLRGLNMVASTRVPTMAVDKYWRMYYNEGFVKFLVALAKRVSPQKPCSACKATAHHPLAYVAGVLTHESWHITQGHAKRFEDTGYTLPKRWNISSDLEMNDDIPEAAMMAYKDAQRQNFPLPQLCLPIEVIHIHDPILVEWMPDHMQHPGMLPDGKPNCVECGVLPSTFKLPDGETAEWYYNNLPEEVGDGSEFTDIEIEIDASQMPSLMGKPGSPKPDANGKIRVKVRITDTAHGSAVDNVDAPWEEGEPGEGKSPGMSQAEQQAVRREVAQKMQAAKGQGTLPGGFSVWADTVLAPPKYDWKKEMRAEARVAINRCRGEMFSTYRRPSRTSMIHDFKVVKANTYSVHPNVYVVDDTSGSMGSGADSPLSRALSETESIIKICRGTAYFIDCDSAVYSNAQKLTSVKRAKVHGGGGTDMRIGVRAAVASKPKPDIIILLTDGYTDWPASPAELKGARFVVGIIGQELPRGIPDWIHPILINVV